MAGGALFGAFPLAYADAMSAFYLAIMLVLFGLILRAVSLEFRSHGSRRLAIRLRRGVLPREPAPGAALRRRRGQPDRGDRLRAGRGGPQVTSSSLFALITPYTLLVGLTGLAMFLMVGASWAALKTEGALQRRTAAARSVMQIVFVVLFVAVTAATSVNSVAKEQLSNGLDGPAGWFMLVVLIGGLGYARWAMLTANDWRAFVGTVAAIVGLIGVAAAGMYPALSARTPATTWPSRSQTRPPGT